MNQSKTFHRESWRIDKPQCRAPKAAPLQYRDLHPIRRNAGTLKLRPDQKILYQRNWDDAKARLAGAAKLVQALAKIARVTTPEADTALPQPTPDLLKARAARA